MRGAGVETWASVHSALACHPGTWELLTATNPFHWLPWLSGKESSCNAGDSGLIPGSGRQSRERNGNPLQYSCQENHMDGGAWWATAHEVAKELDTAQ